MTMEDEQEAVTMAWGRGLLKFWFRASGFHFKGKVSSALLICKFPGTTFPPSPLFSPGQKFSRPRLWTLKRPPFFLHLPVC